MIGGGNNSPSKKKYLYYVPHDCAIGSHPKTNNISFSSIEHMKGFNV